MHLILIKILNIEQLKYNKKNRRIINLKKNKKIRFKTKRIEL